MEKGILRLKLPAAWLEKRLTEIEKAIVDGHTPGRTAKYDEGKMHVPLIVFSFVGNECIRLPTRSRKTERNHSGDRCNPPPAGPPALGRVRRINAYTRQETVSNRVNVRRKSRVFLVVFVLTPRNVSSICVCSFGIYFTDRAKAISILTARILSVLGASETMKRSFFATRSPSRKSYEYIIIA